MDYETEILEYIKTKHSLASLQEENDLFASGIIDSFGIVELIADLEAQYRIKFNAEDLQKANLKNVKVIAQLIKDKKK